MKYIFLLLALIVPFSTFAKPCGLAGTIEERIKECAQTKGNFVLVAVTEKGQEFYKDLKSHLIWGFRIPTDFNHYGTAKACEEDISGYTILSALKWRLPSINEYESASAHGMKAALQNTEHTYWSSTPVKHRTRRRKRTVLIGAYLWDSFAQKSDVGDLKDGASVRCVAKE